MSEKELLYAARRDYENLIVDPTGPGSHERARAFQHNLTDKYSALLRIDELEAQVRLDREALLAWDTWEGDLILDDAAWGGNSRSQPIITQPHLDALTPAQMLRNRALDQNRKVVP